MTSTAKIWLHLQSTNINEVRNVTEDFYVSNDRQQLVLANCLLQNHGNELHSYGYVSLAIYKITPTNTTEVNVSNCKVLTL